MYIYFTAIYRIGYRLTVGTIYRFIGYWNKKYYRLNRSKYITKRPLGYIHFGFLISGVHISSDYHAKRLTNSVYFKHVSEYPSSGQNSRIKTK